MPIFASNFTSNSLSGTATVVLNNLKDPAAAALQIGQSAAKALEKIGRKNAA